MDNVVPISRRFDQEVDTALVIANEPPTEVLPMFDALLAGPASPMDAAPMPQHLKPQAAPECRCASFRLVFCSYILGACHGVAMVYFSIIR